MIRRYFSSRAPSRKTLSENDSGGGKLQPGNGSSRFSPVHDVLLHRQTDHDRRQDGLAGRGRIRRLLPARGLARKACAFASACFGGRAANYVWRIQCVEEGEGRDWSLVHSVGRSVG